MYVRTIALAVSITAAAPSRAPGLTRMSDARIGVAGEALHTPRVQEPRIQVAGSWQINEAESQRPRSSRGERGEGRRGGTSATPTLGVAGTGGSGGGGGGGGGRRRGGGGGGGGGGGAPGGSGGGARSAGGPEAQLRDAIDEVLRNSTNLMIQQQDSAVTFADEDGAAIVVHTNGKNTKMEWGEAGKVETKAQWTKDGLSIERKFDGGVKVRELYQRTPDSPKLTVITTVSSKILEQDLIFKRVYDPAPAGSK
jgi:hypothetical protein